VPGDDDAVRHGSFVARRQTFQVAVLSTISRLWVLPQQRFFVPVEFLKDPPQAWWKWRMRDIPKELELNSVLLSWIMNLQMPTSGHRDLGPRLCPPSTCE
jgi:hypothetical protein